MIGYELKKIWCKRRGWLWLLLVLSVQISFIFTRRDAAYLNFEMEEEKPYFLQYVNEYAENNPSQAYTAIQQEMNDLNQIHEKASTAVADYKAGKISEKNFVNIVDAERIGHHQRRALNIIFEQAKRMKAGEPQMIQYTNGWSVLLNRNTPNMLLLLLLGCLVVPVIYTEYRTEMMPFLNSTKNGNEKFMAAKIIAVLFSVIGIVIVFELTEFICIDLRYGLPDGSFPIQSIQYLEQCPWHMSAVKGFAVRLCLLVFGTCYFAVLLFYLTLTMKKAVPAIIAGFGITLFPIWMLNETKYPYILPLPLGLLQTAGYLQGSYHVRLTEITLSKQEIHMAIILSCLMMGCLAVCSIFRVRYKAKIIALIFVCLPLSGCSDIRSDAKFAFCNANLPSYQTTADYSVYTDANGNLLVSDLKNDTITSLLHDPFLRGHTIWYPSWYVEGKYVYRLETEYSHAADNTSIAIDRVIRTNLVDYSETILYEETLTGRTHSTLLGLEEYLPIDYEQSDSALQFAVNGDYIVLVSQSGIYQSVKGGRRTPLVKGDIKEWGICGNILFYISEDYLLHSFSLISSNDYVMSDTHVHKLIISKMTVCAVPLDSTRKIIRINVN